MSVTAGQFWILAHIALGVGFLHAFAGGITTLLASSTTQLAETRLKRLVRVSSTGLMAAISWLAVMTGTWLVYPGYRAKPPAGTTDLLAYPQAALQASPNTAGWHDFAMEWKEHVGWIAPFLATAVAFVVMRYGPRVAGDQQLRRMLSYLFLICALTGLVAAVLGSGINKVAPNQFLEG